MYEQIEVTIKGVSPLLMHNGQMVNPLNPIVKQLKEVTKKRNKTDDDMARMSELEWYGGIYVDENDCPVIPGEMLEAVLINGAKKRKMGPKAKAGIICDGNFKIKYKGPKKASSLFDNKNFVDVRKVNVQRSSIMRTRPIFKDWELTFTVNYLPSQLDMEDVLQFIDIAGVEVGIGDYRPKFGRYERV